MSKAKRGKRNLQWIHQTLKLQPEHRWEGTPGYKIFVAGRGAVRFDVPGDWCGEPQTASFRFTDVEPPNDNCCLEVSHNLLPPHDWQDFPLERILEEVIDRDERDVIETGPIHQVNRVALRLVWAELKFIDPTEQREAFSRIAIGLGGGVQCLITCEFWADQAEKFTPVWDVVLKSLTLGLKIKDPTLGTALPD